MTEKQIRLLTSFAYLTSIIFTIKTTIDAAKTVIERERALEKELEAALADWDDVEGLEWMD